MTSGDALSDLRAMLAAEVRAELAAKPERNRPQSPVVVGTGLKCSCCRAEIGIHLHAVPFVYSDGAVRWRCINCAREPVLPRREPNPHPSMPRSDHQYHGANYQP